MWLFQLTCVRSLSHTHTHTFTRIRKLATTFSYPHAISKIQQVRSFQFSDSLVHSNCVRRFLCCVYSGWYIMCIWDCKDTRTANTHSLIHSISTREYGATILSLIQFDLSFSLSRLILSLFDSISNWECKRSNDKKYRFRIHFIWIFVVVFSSQFAAVSLCLVIHALSFAYSSFGRLVGRSYSNTFDWNVCVCTLYSAHCTCSQTKCVRVLNNYFILWACASLCMCIVI